MYTVRLSVRQQLNTKQWAKVFKPFATATQPAVQNADDNTKKEIKTFETLKNITKKTRTKKPQKPPFVKNLCVGVFDNDLLTYHQLEKEEVINLEQDVYQVERLIGQKHMTDCDSLNNKNFRQNLSDYKAIGLQASQFLDGKECNVTESFRFLEALSKHNLSDSLICNEQLSLQTLVRYASDAMKKRCLPSLMKGERLCAFCLTEKELVDMNTFSTKAELSADKKSWILNGTKSWVTNAISADYYIVFALSNIKSKETVRIPKLTAFLVPKDSSGVSVTRKDVGDIEIADITFDNITVPEENVIGVPHKAEAILQNVIPEYRLSLGLGAATMTKKILNKLSRHFLDQSDTQNMLYKTDAVREKIGEMITLVYAMESLPYLTSGLLDTYQDQDVELECNITKVFCSENLLKISTSCMDLIGIPAVEKSHWANKLHLDALRYSTLHESNDSLKMMLALQGLQYAGVKTNDKINKIRNPLFHAGFTLKRMWTTRRNTEDNPKLDLELGAYLHPSLFVNSQQLEYCVKRLEFAVELLLARYGPEVVNRHIELRRLADCIIDVYTMVACLSRASRSYCIGLQHSHSEMVIASSFCLNAMERVRYKVNKIYYGMLHTTDENYKDLAKTLFKFKGYFPKHPLSRNF